MNKVDLKPYPFPEGMAIPRLMPFQEYPWNGDGYLAAEVLRLKAAHGLNAAIETGTCLGSTTCWMIENFDNTNTIEINKAFEDIAWRRFDMLDLRRVGGHSGNSAELLLDIVKFYGARSFVFLDAHWNEHCPLLDELEAIAYSKVKPCIIIHDFQVPGTDFGFDKMPDGRPFNLELIAGHLDSIYGAGGWSYRYPDKVEGARRGWVSIAPTPIRSTSTTHH